MSDKGDFMPTAQQACLMQQLEDEEALQAEYTVLDPEIKTELQSDEKEPVDGGE
jgi:hypothetical protein